MLTILYKIAASLLLICVLAGTAAAEEGQFLIAVAGESTEPVSRISKVAARSPYFLIFDRQSSLLKTLKNPAVSVSGGAGPRAADFLSEQKINLVIAGQFGSKMKAALKSSKIQTIERQGLVLDAVKEQNHAQ